MRLPPEAYFANLHDRIKHETSGAVAAYIPERTACRWGDRHEEGHGWAGCIRTDDAGRKSVLRPHLRLLSHWGPARMAPAVVHTINDAFNAALAVPEVRTRLATLGVEPLGGTATRFASYVAAELARWH